MKATFWICFAGIAYAYFGYPILLSALGWLKRVLLTIPERHFSMNDAPPITLLIPLHNEEDVLARKLENTISLQYPGKLEIVFVSDGSTDGTTEIVRSFGSVARLSFIELPVRKGKANALNVGLERATGEIVVFSDASIMLESNALWDLVQPFADPAIGCVSGEDRIEGGSGEGLYGKYELFLRDRESQIGSIVGASGSFYAQRRHLIRPFRDGFAPDFLSVLNTVEQGARAVSEPRAVGYMTAVESSADEFQRKVRTLVRGMTALFAKKTLLNPLRYPAFSFFLFSHKLMRWWVPFFLLGTLGSSALMSDQSFFLTLLILQLLFYGFAALAHYWQRPVADTLAGKIVTYFTVVNLAILVAWIRYLTGVRQEIWTPSRRSI